MNKKIFFTLIVICLITLGCSSSSISDKNTENNTTSNKNESINKKNDSINAEHEPQIRYSISISPQKVKKGEKVKLIFEIENLDKNETIFPLVIHLLDEPIMKDGIIVTNVSNGKLDLTHFDYNDEKTKILPNQKQIFNVEATANKPGNYQTRVGITTPKKYKYGDLILTKEPYPVLSLKVTD